MKVTPYIYNLLPRSLTSRFLLIIAVPTIIAQLIAVYIFYDRHWSNIFLSTSNMVAKEIKLLIDISTTHNMKDAIKEAKIIGIRIEHLSAKDGKKERVTTSPELQGFVRTLERILKRRSYATLINDESEIQILVQMDDGYLKIRRSAKPLIHPTTYIFAIWVIALTGLLLIVSLIFSRNQIRSILELASAADSFGRGSKDADNYKPSGALEIRRAGLAFLRMKERIERSIAKRTQMLAMISHDLKTPLTRLKLQLEMLDESEEIGDMKRDVENMSQMISSYLDFARGEGGEELQERHILDWFKENILSNSYGNLEIACAEDADNSVVMIKPIAFKRAIENIVTNAAKYAGRLVIEICTEEDMVVMNFDDNGIGISDEEKSQVFKPFYRSDSSRHIDSQGSVGLGLSITREIIVGHHGEISLHDSMIGGLKVRITLPRL